MGKIHYKWPFSIAMLVYQRVRHTIAPKLGPWQDIRCLQVRGVPWAKLSSHPTDRLWGIDSRLLWLQQKEAGTTWGDGKMVEDGKVPNGISISYRKIIRKYIWVQIELSIHNFGRILPSYHADVGSKSYAPWEKHLVGTCNASRSYNFFIDLNGVL